MRDPKKIIPEDRKLIYLRGCDRFQFADRVTKLLGDCLDQINEFFEVLSTIKDGADGADGKDGADGDTPYIKNGYWWIGDTNTNVPARGEKGPKGDAFLYSDFTQEQLNALKGPKGDTGEQGIPGEKGDKGEQGDVGPKGDTGAKGDKGDKGDKGSKGDKGDAFTYNDFTSAQLAALKGEKGDKGDKGDTGEKGETGATGATGPQGPQGIQGEQGPQGEAGASDWEDINNIPSNLAYTSNDSGEGIIPQDGIRAVTVASAAAMTINPDVVTVINGAVGTAAITLQVPNDNLAHVWDIILTTDSTVAITFAMSNSETILYPDGFALGASKAVEVSVIGVGTKYYLRYGEFA